MKKEKPTTNLSTGQKNSLPQGKDITMPEPKIGYGMRVGTRTQSSARKTIKL
jgi:hypothetical protein